jgi:hypothetical protein
MTRRLYIPAFGITLVLTSIAVYHLIAGGRNAANVILWLAVIICLWSLYLVVRKKTP